MAVVNMDRRAYDKESWYKELAIESEAESDVIAVPPPPTGAGFTVTLDATGATGKVQTTTSPDADVRDDSADWDDWDLGDISTRQSRVVGAVTGIKAVSTTGAMTLRVVG